MGENWKQGGKIEDEKKLLADAFLEHLTNAKNPLLPPNPQAAQVTTTSMIPVDTSLPTPDFLSDLKKCLEDNTELLKRDLKSLADEYEIRERELERISGQVRDLETCIKALDND